MASIEEYRRKANMHERYLGECRIKRKTNSSYADMIVDVAADMGFCDRAAINFDADLAVMAQSISTDIERYLERPHISTDIPPSAYAKAMRQRCKTFADQAAQGKYFVP